MAQIAEPQLSFADFSIQAPMSPRLTSNCPLKTTPRRDCERFRLQTPIIAVILGRRPLMPQAMNCVLAMPGIYLGIPDESVHLIVTSPPYWTLKQYKQDNPNQMGDIEEYDAFLAELDMVWAESRSRPRRRRSCLLCCWRCLYSSQEGWPASCDAPWHSDIQVRSRRLGLDCLTPILWHKIANGVTEVAGNGSGFYGKPYQPGAIIKNDVEYILFLRRVAATAAAAPLEKALSMLTKEEMQSWMRSIWSDIRGTSTRNGHPAPYPVELAERLIRMVPVCGRHGP